MWSCGDEKGNWKGDICVFWWGEWAGDEEGVGEIILWDYKNPLRLRNPSEWIWEKIFNQKSFIYWT